MTPAVRAAALGLVILAAAGAAAAQVLTTPRLDAQQRLDLQMRLDAFQMQADMARQREVVQQNQLTTLDAQLRAEQGLADVRAQSAAPRLPEIPSDALGPLPNIDTSKLASIPDAALAASNQRVQDAASNRR